MKVYVRHGSLTVGPSSLDEVYSAIARGQIAPSDLVCVDTENWVRAGDVPQFIIKFRAQLNAHHSPPSEVKPETDEAQWEASGDHEKTIVRHVLPVDRHTDVVERAASSAHVPTARPPVLEPPRAQPSGHAPHRTHGMALALRGRCPFCAEVTSSPSVLSAVPCTVCGGAFDDPEFADRILEGMTRLSKERFGLVLGGSVLLSLASCLPGIGSAISMLGSFAGFMAFRILVVNPALALMSKSRRRVASWTVRLILAAVLAIMSVVLILPAASAAGAAIGTGAAWWSGRAYVLWQLRQERQALPVKGFEYALLIGLLGSLLLVFTMVTVVIASVWSFVAEMLG